MFTRLACPLLSCLLHAALLYAISHISVPNLDEGRSEPQRLQVTFAQPKPQAPPVAVEARPKRPLPLPVERKPAPETTTPPPEKKPERAASPAPAPRLKPETPAPKQRRIDIITKHKDVATPAPAPQPPEFSQRDPVAAPGNVAAQPAAATSQDKSPLGGSQPSAESELLKLEDDYRQDLLRAIARHKTYPDAARRRGREGEVEVRFSLRQDGTISRISIEESSGWRGLDQAAIKSLKRLGRFKPIPAELKRENWEFLVTIRFYLE